MIIKKRRVIPYPDPRPAGTDSRMTVKKRLVISNVLMIVVPVVITLLIAAGCVGIVWFQIAHGTGLGFEDSESFYRACTGISDLAAKTLKSPRRADQVEKLKTLSSLLDRDAMSLVVTADGREIYRYGESRDTRLRTAALALGREGTVSSGKHCLHIRPQDSHGVHYQIFLYGTERELSYSDLKTAVILTGSVLIFTVLLSVALTDRFLTHFVVRHVEDPLKLLSDGVEEISRGNLDYRLEYTGRDEFLPVCENFNDMARRLKESVERSRREEESRKELMAGISHDLRTPLTSIQAYVEGLLDGVASTPEMQRKYLLTVKTRAEELERMVERILTYSRMELGNAPRNAELLALDEYLRREISEASADYAGRGLELSAELEPFSVTADPAELHQLLVNIADNSLKYGARSRVLLRIRLRNEGTHCVLSFTDDGPGVPDSALPKLFDEFYRADPSRSDRTKGSGLGLAIVKKTALRMGGSVQAEQAAGGGLSIVLTIPKGEENHAENSDH
jgi:signal transduction histidine kinase